MEASVTVKPSYGLADADIERMLRDSFEHAKEDMHARALAEQRVDGQRLLEATRAALHADGALLAAEEERRASRPAMQALEKLLPGTDHRAIKQAVEALNRATEEFAARRMDAGVKRALAGTQDRQPLMPKLKVLPHATLCPQGAEIEARAGQVDLRHAARAPHRHRARLREVLRLHHLPRDRARRASTRSSRPRRRKRTCSTRPGAWRRPRAFPARRRWRDEDLVIEIPKYTINYEREGGGEEA